MAANFDLEEDAVDSTQRVHASAPPFTEFHYVPGYESTPTDFSSECIHPMPEDYLYDNSPPPSYEDVISNESGTGVNSMDSQIFLASGIRAMSLAHQSLNNRALIISEEDALEALSKYISGSCCYGKSLPKHIRTKKIQPSNSYQYILETFYEERSTRWKREPFNHQLIDSVQNGDPPMAWNMLVTPPGMFEKKETSREIPHTASIKECHNCKGKGQKKCTICNGTGVTRCRVCDGLGLIYHHSQEDMKTEYDGSTRDLPRTCNHCNGGKKKCHQCTGNGNTTCPTCLGNRAMKVYLLLTVKWKTLHAQKVFKRSKLPESAIDKVTGTKVFEEENRTVCPLLDFPINEVNHFSRKMIRTHQESVQHGKILMQRHFIREVPAVEVLTEWKNKEFSYWVYGKENHVYCPDYPAKCPLL